MTKNTIFIICSGKGRDCLSSVFLSSYDLPENIINFDDFDSLRDFLFKHEAGLLFRVNTPYILFVDSGLGRDDCLSLLSDIKDDSRLKRMPVVVFGNCDEGGFVKSCYSCGGSVYIEKPSDEKGLVEVVRKLKDFLESTNIPVMSLR